ncbi:hypothetical protein B0H16DRAFT_1739597 [Mycena metata]|uniref:Uncharacterized protein n=1 Tax=Mycena metata TaxID=1033252 RepID=A0AAD7HFR1_9AGAR|nr:hypothetical protein B0H16DRAFT_1739597 [Mycena metata]
MAIATMLGLRLRSASNLNSPAPDRTSSFASLVFPTADSTEPTSVKADVAKTVIEWLFVVIAVVLIACLLLRKILASRASSTFARDSIASDTRDRHLSLVSMAIDPCYVYSYGYIPDVRLPIPTPTYPRPTHRLPYPVAIATSSTARRTRAADIDAYGRRAHEDVELVLGDKDILPVYDGLGRPPKYTITTPPPAAAEAAVAPEAEGTGSGRAGSGGGVGDDGNGGERVVEEVRAELPQTTSTTHGAENVHR